MSSSWKRKSVIVLKFAVPAAIVVWLLMRVPEDQLQMLREREKNWPLLGAAFLLTLLAVCLTFWRWYLLVRALNLRFRLADAFRLGFLGYLFNFVSVGSVGGDLFKAFFLAREQPGRRAEAVATVFVDRMIGLYALLVLSSAVILGGGISRQSVVVATICRTTLLATGVGAIGIVLVLVPGFTNGAVSEMLTGIPKAGPMIGRLITAVRIYRRRWPVMAVTLIMGLGTHLSLSIAFYCIGHALWPHAPTFGETLVIVPLGMLAGALPFTPAGLGTFELVIDQLYRVVPAGSDAVVSGILIASVYRLITIGIAMIGVIVYWTSRAEVQELLVEAEEQEEC